MRGKVAFEVFSVVEFDAYDACNGVQFLSTAATPLSRFFLTSGHTGCTDE
jgi:hypothetical protein